MRRSPARDRRLPLQDPRGLAHLNQVAVRITQIAADLGAPVGRGSEELRAAAGPLVVDRADVGDPDAGNADMVQSSGAASVTVGLSSVGPPPLLMMIHR